MPPTKPDQRDSKIAEQATQIERLEMIVNALSVLGKSPERPGWTQRKAATIAMLKNPETARLTNRAIGALTGASHMAVWKLRKKLEEEEREAKVKPKRKAARAKKPK